LRNVQRLLDDDVYTVLYWTLSPASKQASAAGWEAPPTPTVLAPWCFRLAGFHLGNHMHEGRRLKATTAACGPHRRRIAGVAGSGRTPKIARALRVRRRHSSIASFRNCSVRGLVQLRAGSRSASVRHSSSWLSLASPAGIHCTIHLTRTNFVGGAARGDDGDLVAVQLGLQVSGPQCGLRPRRDALVGHGNHAVARRQYTHSIQCARIPASKCLVCGALSQTLFRVSARVSAKLSCPRTAQLAGGNARAQQQTPAFA